MFSIAVILMKHIYMYNTTFCLNSQSLAFFFLNFFFLLHLHNSYTLDDEDVFPQNINLVTWIMCLELACICVGSVFNVCVFACVCVCVCVCACACA